MKRINPCTNLPFKYGDIREDGFYFQAYTKKIKKNGYFLEIWLFSKKWSENKIKSNERIKEKRKKDPEYFRARDRKSYANNIEKHRENDRLWAQLNKDKISAKQANRRASKEQRTPKWLTKKQLEQIADFYKMAKELDNIFPWKHHVDHIVPLKGDKVSGFHVPENLQILSEKMNLEKSNKYMII
jgi:hypothetical protein